MRFVVFKKRTLIGVALMVTLLAAAVVATSLTGSAAVWQGKINRKLPICSVDTGQKSAAITFDAGFDAETTQALLGILEEKGVLATFFVSGTWAEINSASLNEIAKRGHEIGTLGATNSDLAKLKTSKIKLELQTSCSIIKGVTGKEVKLFRPPFGSYNDRVLEAAQALNLKTIMWDVAPSAEGVSEQYLISSAVGMVKTGSIILLRCGAIDDIMLKALPSIIEGIRGRGFGLVPVGGLIYESDYTIDHTGKQIRSK